MTDTLIARLRDTYPKFIAFTDIPHIASEAADRIEALQAELGQYPEIQAMLMTENKELRVEVAELKAQEPVAWRYVDESSFDGDKWHTKYAVTTSKKVADFKSGTLKKPEPLFLAAGAAPKEQP